MGNYGKYTPSDGTFDPVVNRLLEIADEMSKANASDKKKLTKEVAAMLQALGTLGPSRTLEHIKNTYKLDAQSTQINKIKNVISSLSSHNNKKIEALMGRAKIFRSEKKLTELNTQKSHIDTTCKELQEIYETKLTNTQKAGLVEPKQVAKRFDHEVKPLLVQGIHLELKELVAKRQDSYQTSAHDRNSPENSDASLLEIAFSRVLGTRLNDTLRADAVCLLLGLDPEKARGVIQEKLAELKSELQKNLSRVQINQPDNNQPYFHLSNIDKNAYVGKLVLCKLRLNNVYTLCRVSKKTSSSGDTFYLESTVGKVRIHKATQRLLEPNKVGLEKNTFDLLNLIPARVDERGRIHEEARIYTI